MKRDRDCLLKTCFVAGKTGSPITPPPFPTYIYLHVKGVAKGEGGVVPPPPPPFISSAHTPDIQIEPDPPLLEVININVFTLDRT